MSPDAFWGSVALVVILFIALGVIRDMFAYRRRNRSRLYGWYHEQESSARRTPIAWRQAADLSTQRSRDRRQED
jgi:hypothetical protein